MLRFRQMRSLQKFRCRSTPRSRTISISNATSTAAPPRKLSRPTVTPALAEWRQLAA